MTIIYLKIRLDFIFAVIIINVLCFNAIVFAAPVDTQFAENVATNFIKADTQNQKQSDYDYIKMIKNNEIINYFSPQSKVTNVVSLKNDIGENVAYVCELSPSGYIVLSSDTDIEPILAYSYSGKFPYIQFDKSDASKLKSNPLSDLIIWDAESRILAAKQQIVSYEIISNNNKKWESIQEGDYKIANKTDPVYFIKIAWHQRDPYNKFCPMDLNWLNERSVSGCLAIAIAQILGYWNYPTSVTLSESDSYITDSRKINIDDNCIENDFLSFTQLNDYLKAISYAWEDDIAALIFACGIFVKMDYTEDDGSTANITDAPSAFINKLKYSSAILAKYSSSSLLSEMTIAKRPAIIRIAKNNGSGHFVNVDGYDSTKQTYHINFGWGSSSPDNINDVWYSLPSGLPSNYTVVTHTLYKIIPISPPTNLSASDGTYSDKIYLSWSSVPNATKYEVYRGISSSSSSATKVASTTSRYYSDTSAAAGTTYYYWVKACAGSTSSSLSNSNTGYRAVSLSAPTVEIFKIRNGVSSTAFRTVTLNNSATCNPTHYMASESSSFAGSSWLSYSASPVFTLSSGNGSKIVYFKVKNSRGESSRISDTIILNEGPNLCPYKPKGWSNSIVVSKTTGTTTDSTPIYSTDTLYIDWALINNGAIATSKIFYTTLYVDGNAVCRWYTNPLNASYYSFVMDYKINSLTIGQHTIKIKIDSEGFISETSESDNEYTRNITILSH